MATTTSKPARRRWLSTETSPPANGVYEVQWFIGSTVHAKFIDGRWRIGSHDGVDAASRVRNWARISPLRWRVLAQDPAVSA